MSIDSQTLSQWRRLAGAAQPAPWEAVPEDPSNIIDGNGFHVCRTMPPSNDPDHEADFICAARTAVPALLDECERLRALLREAWMAIAGYPFANDITVRIDAAVGGGCAPLTIEDVEAALAVGAKEREAYEKTAKRSPRR